MEKEKLKLSEYALLCSKFEESPTNTELLDQIKEFLSNLVIQEYLPLKKKEIIVVNVLNLLNKDFDAPGAAVFLEIGKVVTALLSYCVNLEVDITPLIVGHFLVDVIHKYGLYNAVFSICHEDCTRLFNMIDNAVNVSNIYRLLETASLFDHKAYDQWIESMNQLKDTLDSKTLQDVLKAIKPGDKGDEDLMGQISKMAVEMANKELQNEAQKFEKAMKAQEASVEMGKQPDTDDVN